MTDMDALVLHKPTIDGVAYVPEGPGFNSELEEVRLGRSAIAA
jgi:hypothetical protein